ncbi:MAG: RNA 2',3'-cyclic phosphodiesterase [Candidatus Diapherotrites archaeon]|nr:RNA 2',3'-cyclic phosphodiesterase [Candidatus Diapherotrites archaeon]
MRCFIGVPLTDNVRKGLSEMQKRLKHSSTKMKLVEPENLHITLRFLGEIADVEVAKPLLEGISIKKFHVQFTHIGAFPSRDYIRVVWAGVGQGRDELVELYKAVGGKNSLEPHVTLARVKTKPDALLLEMLDEKLDLSMDAERVQLIESKLTPTGPIYSKVFEVEFD